MTDTDAFRGCIVGLAVGDALGYRTEFRTREQIIDTFGPGGVEDFVAQKDERWQLTRDAWDLMGRRKLSTGI